MSLNQPADCAQDFFTSDGFQSGRPVAGLAELIAEESGEHLELRDRCLEQLRACNHDGEFSVFELHGHRALWKKVQERLTSGGATTKKGIGNALSLDVRGSTPTMPTRVLENKIDDNQQRRRGETRKHGRNWSP